LHNVFAIQCGNGVSSLNQRRTSALRQGTTPTSNDPDQQQSRKRSLRGGTPAVGKLGFHLVNDLTIWQRLRELEEKLYDINCKMESKCEHESELQKLLGDTDKHAEALGCQRGVEFKESQRGPHRANLRAGDTTNCAALMPH